MRKFRRPGGGEVSPPGASDFANSGKVTKAPFKGEMFRLISPLKIPLSATKKGASAPLLDYPLGKGETCKFHLLAGMK